MKILNIHSGVTNEKIIEFLFGKQEKNNKSIIKEAEELEKSEQKIYEEYYDEVSDVFLFGMFNPGS